MRLAATRRGGLSGAWSRPRLKWDRRWWRRQV